jgi:Zn-dependent M28 family amino/carboxypeptidase
VTPVRAGDEAVDTGPLSAGAIMSDVEWMVADERKGRGSYQPGGTATSDYFFSELGAIGLEVSRQHVDAGVDNIIAIKPGDDRAIIVSAHYDHLGVVDGVLYPGADDNASGAAVLLALARDAVARDYQHTIVFIAFGAEEAGLVGSAVYIQDPVWPLDQTDAIINFDMVGRNFFEWGSNQEATAGVVGLEEDDEVRAAAERAAADAGLKLVPAPARMIEVFENDFRTDEWWFRRADILAIHFSTGLHDDYHQPSDTADKLVPAQMERVARTAAGLLEHLAGAKP